MSDFDPSEVENLDTDDFWDFLASLPGEDPERIYRAKAAFEEFSRQVPFDQWLAGRGQGEARS